jgi:hypothetical protein
MGLTPSFTVAALAAAEAAAVGFAPLCFFAGGDGDAASPPSAGGAPPAEPSDQGLTPVHIFA